MDSNRKKQLAVVALVLVALVTSSYLVYKHYKNQSTPSTPSTPTTPTTEPVSVPVSIPAGNYVITSSTKCLIPVRNANTGAPVQLYNWGDPTTQCGLPLSAAGTTKQPFWKLIPVNDYFKIQSLTPLGENLYLTSGSAVTSPTNASIFNVIPSAVHATPGSYNCYIQNASTGNCIVFNSSSNSFTETSCSADAVYTFVSVP